MNIHAWDQFLFVALPYVCLFTFLLMTIYRYRQQSFSYSSLSSQFLENKQHFWAVVPFHYGILAVTRMIMMGNAIGIPSGSFFLRFRGKADPRSNVFYEIMMMLAMIVFFPLTGLTALALNLVKAPILRFQA